MEDESTGSSEGEDEEASGDGSGSEAGDSSAEDECTESEDEGVDGYKKGAAVAQLSRAVPHLGLL